MSATALAANDPPVLRRDQGAIAILTLNRPKTRNALSRAMLAALTAELDALAAEEAIRSGKERLDLMSFGDDLVLPLVSMTQSARRRMPQPAAG